jgi:hypothetical protein
VQFGKGWSRKLKMIDRCERDITARVVFEIVADEAERASFLPRSTIPMTIVFL